MKELVIKGRKFLNREKEKDKREKQEKEKR